MTRTDDPLQTTRDLLDREASLRHGFLDVLGESVASETPTLAQVAMNSRLVATVYNGCGARWRFMSPAESPRAPSNVARRKHWTCQGHPGCSILLVAQAIS